eukprot:s2216_g7.t1
MLWAVETGYTFKEIYSAWSQMPITLAAHKEMGRFLATKTFMTNCPAPVMEMPIHSLHDSKEALRFRAICDERITLPRVREAGGLLSPRGDAGHQGELEVQCLPHLVAQFTAEEAVPLYRAIGAMGCLLPPGAPGPVGGGGTPTATELQANPGKFQFPPLTPFNVTSVAGLDYKKKHFGGKHKHVFWGAVECGLILPSISSWEIVSKEKSVTTGGYMCKFCKDFWKAGRGGSRFLQIVGRHRGQMTALQMVLDEPPQDLHNQWIKDRMEFYKRVEPLAAPRDERVELVGCQSNRLRFSSSNGMGPTSDLIWSIILKNEEIQGLKLIQQVARSSA